MIALRRGIIKIMSGGGIAPPNSDINGDGDIMLDDVAILQLYIAGMMSNSTFAHEGYSTGTNAHAGNLAASCLSGRALVNEKVQFSALRCGGSAPLSFEFLIDGKVVPYMSESVYTEKPLTKNSF